MDLDTRAQAARMLGIFDRKAWKAVLKTLGCGAFALAVLKLPGLVGSDIYDDLNPAAHAALGIMLLAAALWVTEAMPAFAVGLLVIGLEIAILGKPGGVWAAEGDSQAWTTFVKEWASPTMWLFLGGFVLAHACSKTRLDRWLAGILLGRLVSKPARLVGGVMAVTFVFSMFMSNTATAAMMVAVTAPIVAGLPRDSRLVKGLVVGVAVAANLGGIGTIIGSPPNAIAAGQMPAGQALDFIQWMKVALPPAVMLALLAYGLIWRLWIRGEPGLSGGLEPEVRGGGKQALQRWIVMAVFAVTVTLWMAESLTHIPSPVVSFIPIVVLAVSGVIEGKDMRELPWDVLILLAGGLSLGVAVQVTGLADWLAGRVPTGLSPAAVALVFSVLAIVLSNLMSNTAAAALLIPLGVSVVGPENARLVTVSVAIACSAAMALPISTPPNAIAYGTGRISGRDFLLPGLVIGVATLLVFPWLRWVLG